MRDVGSNIEPLEVTILVSPSSTTCPSSLRKTGWSLSFRFPCKRERENRSSINQPEGLLSVLFLTFSGLEKRKDENERGERRKWRGTRREISPTFIPETLSAASSLSTSSALI